MELFVNGDPARVPDGLTVAGLVRYLGIDGPVAVEQNALVVPRAEHDQTLLAEGDRVEIVHFVGGG